MQLEQRFAIAAFMREEWQDFTDFALAGMKFLGFPLTHMQRDIAEFMQTGPRLRMVMAQRGEAKSTLAALYAVWRIVQQPSTRILVVSGGEQQASEVASLIIRLITSWEMLEYLRPDKKAGDRTSLDAFDVNFVLKGIDKSPSVACVGITANLQGKRADVLIPDDIETTKNGLTVTQREHLMVLTREFTSINTHGDILYLGTPQTKDSIYNTLARRGFTIRIWPGRYPTTEECEKYGDRLAPYLADAIAKDPSLQSGGGLDGKRGKPADPQRYDEAALVEKELDQGPEGFQLQFMLDTSLADAMRQQLKLEDLVVANFDHERLPEYLVHQKSKAYAVDLGTDFPLTGVRMYHPVPTDGVLYHKPVAPIMFIDPAGGGGDEIGYGISTTLGPYIHVLDVGGIMGGLTEENGKALCDIVRELGVQHIRVESNMGHGLFEINLRAILAKHELADVGVSGEYSTGQKERRIIDSLVGVLQRHKLVIHRRVFQSDTRWNKQHTPDKRAMRSVFYQLQNITTDRNSLPKDDRLEALAGCVRYHKHVLEQSEEAAAQARRVEEAREYMDNPMGYTDPGFHSTPKARGTRNLVQRRRY